MSQDDRIPVQRSIEFSMEQPFRPKFIETCASRYTVAVEASQFDENRMSFNYMAVGDQLLCSSKAYIDLVLTVTGPGKVLDQMASLACLRSVATGAQNVTATGVLAGGPSLDNMIALGESDAPNKACTSAQMTLNSASITSSDRTRFWSTLLRAWVPEKCQSRVFAGCGGPQNSFDSVATGSIIRTAANAVEHSYGATMETALSRRLKNFMSRSVPQAGGADSFTRDLHIRWPITLGPFHPFAGEPVYGGSPFAKLPYGLVGVQQGSFEFLFRNLFSTIVRQLGRLSADGAESSANNRGGTVGGNRVQCPAVAFKEGSKPTLYMEYIRLAAAREFPDQMSYNIFRTQMIPSDEMKVGDGKAYRIPDGICDQNGLVALPPIGRDYPVRTNAISTARVAADAVTTPWRANFDENFSWEVNFRSVQLASPPEFLMLVSEKSNLMYSRNHFTRPVNAGGIYPYGNVTENMSVQGWDAGVSAGAANGQVDVIASRSRSQNSLCNLTWDELEFTVQNSAGSFKYLDRNLAAIRSKDVLYKATIANCHYDYLAKSGQEAHDSRCNFILLNVAQYLFGISSSNVAYPLSISCSAKLTNRCRFICGSQIAANRGHAFPLLHHGPVASEPCMVAIYTNGVLTISSGGSAVVNGWVASQNDFTSAAYRAAKENSL